MKQKDIEKIINNMSDAEFQDYFEWVSGKQNDVEELKRILTETENLVNNMYPNTDVSKKLSEVVKNILDKY